jgi:hypothetical protein
VENVAVSDATNANTRTHQRHVDDGGVDEHARDECRCDYSLVLSPRRRAAHTSRLPRWRRAAIVQRTDPESGECLFDRAWAEFKLVLDRSADRADKTAPRARRTCRGCPSVLAPGRSCECAPIDNLHLFPRRLHTAFLPEWRAGTWTAPASLPGRALVRCQFKGWGLFLATSGDFRLHGRGHQICTAVAGGVCCCTSFGHE